MIYLIKRGLKLETYHRAGYPIFSELCSRKRKDTLYELEGYVEKAGFYYLSVFTTTGFERHLYNLFCELVRQQKGKGLCSIS